MKRKGESVIKKRRSDIRKLISAARDISRQSLVSTEVKRRCRITDKNDVHFGWYVCVKCQEHHEIIKDDHIVPIGKEPETFLEFGPWLEKLFCLISNRQGLCARCHKEKSKRENAERRKK